MTGRWVVRAGLGALVALGIACVTVNIYFPAAEVQKAADKFVGEVRPEAPSSPAESPPAKPQSMKEPLLGRSVVLSAFLGGGEGLLVKAAGLWIATAEAQSVDITISTPAIRNLKASMKGRFPALQPYYQKGLIGENNQGFLEIRSTGGLSLKEQAQLKQLVDAENRDRRALYEEILRANNLDPKFLREVERLFANSWRKEASGRGWPIQRDDGSWSK